MCPMSIFMGIGPPDKVTTFILKLLTNRIGKIIINKSLLIYELYYCGNIPEFFRFCRMFLQVLTRFSRTNSIMVIFIFI